MRIEFIVPAIPVAQPRQRHRVVKSGRRSFAQNYTPARDPVNAFKAACQLAASDAYKGAPLSQPLRLDLEFVFPRTKGQIWKRKPMPRLPHAKKPDRDNLIKSTQDALNGLLYVDDAQIAAGETTKWIASGDEQPHARVVCTPFEAAAEPELLAACREMIEAMDNYGCSVVDDPPTPEYGETMLRAMKAVEKATHQVV